MTDEDKQALAAEIADELEDSGFGIETAGAREVTARLVVDRIEHALYQQGWMPPATFGQVHAWAMRTGNIPEHHINRGVLTSHLTELAAILTAR
jgi:hypothetical protein